MPLQLASHSPFAGFPITLYGRVSKDQRGGRSVAQQLKRGRRWGLDQGCVVVGEFSDNDQSASRYASKAREDWPKVEAQVLAGETRILWVYEISRGTRDLEVWARLARVCRENGVYIVLDDDVYDPTKPSHMRQLNQLMVDAVYESDKTALRLARDAEEMAEEGRPWGYAGFGFKREYDPDTGDLIRQVPDPEQAELIKDIFRRLESGVRPYTIAKELNAARVPSPGGTVAGEERTRKDGSKYRAKGWTHQVVARLVTRPAMVGRRVHHGDIKPAGGWDPILKPDRWELVRGKVQPKPRHRDGAVVHLLSGIAICDVCGALMRVIHREDGRKHAYRCDGLYDGAPEGRGHVQRVKYLLEGQVEGLLFERFSDPDVLSALQEAGPGSAGVEEARGKLLAFQAELEDLYSEVESGQVSRRMAAADEARLKRSIADVEPKTRSVAADPILEALGQGEPSRVWEGWDLHQRREALRLTTEEIRVLKTSARGRRSPSASESVRIVWAGA